MRHERILSTLILCELALGVTGLIIERAAEPAPGSSLRAHLAAAGLVASKERGAFAIVCWAAVVAATIVAWVGLVALVRGARPLYAAAWVAYLVLVLTDGPIVTSAAGRAVEMLTALAGGAILGLIYFSELRTRFRSVSDVLAPAPDRAA